MTAFNPWTLLDPATRKAARGLPDVTEAVLQELQIANLASWPDDAGLAERVMFEPSLTINGLTSGDLRRTIIPGEATARIDMRLVPGQDPARIFELLQAHLARHAPDVTATPDGMMRPSRTPLDNPFTACISTSITRLFGSEPLLVPALGGSLPDHLWTEVLGVPSLGLPLADPDQANHAPNENLRVRRYLDGIELVAAVLTDLGQLGVEAWAPGTADGPETNSDLTRLQQGAEQR
jgi:acetylornithine deacetylase/succinyl-diaminopimelate desuccinylase-like protein